MVGGLGVQSRECNTRNQGLHVARCNFPQDNFRSLSLTFHSKTNAILPYCFTNFQDDGNNISWLDNFGTELGKRNSTFLSPEERREERETFWRLWMIRRNATTLNVILHLTPQHHRGYHWLLY